MSRGLFCSVLAWVVAAGCKHAPAEPQAHTGSVASPEMRIETTDASTGRVQRSPSFARSALTPFANQVTDLLGTVLDNQPLPSGPLPLALWIHSNPLVRSRLELPPRRADLEFIVFSMKLSLILNDEKRVSAAPDPVSPPAVLEPGEIEFLLFLSSAGLKVAQLRLRKPGRAYALPPWLDGVKKAGSEIFETARRGALESLLIGEPERAVLKNDALSDEVLRGLPKRDDIELAQAWARQKPEPIGWRVDKTYLYARDRFGELQGFKLEIEESDGQLVFKTDPLVALLELSSEQ